MTIRKLQASLLHFGPKHYKDAEGKSNTTWDDKSKVWVIINHGDDLFSGYVDNMFGVTELDRDTYQYRDVNLLFTEVFEHANGGRGNHKMYKDVDAYIADPNVKKKYQARIQQSMADSIRSFNDGDRGDPESVDIVGAFEYNDRGFTLKSTRYDVVPVEWYSEIFADQINLSGGVWETAELAIQSVKSDFPVDDLFGQRYFPVAVFPKSVGVLVAEDACSYFKSCSKALFKDDSIVIGIRSKVHEIEYIEKVYEVGGAISKNLQWDWE